MVITITNMIKMMRKTKSVKLIRTIMIIMNTTNNDGDRNFPFFSVPPTSLSATEKPLLSL